MRAVVLTGHGSFDALKVEALRLGFRWVESGPLVRSSYHAERQVDRDRLVSLRSA